MSKLEDGLRLAAPLVDIAANLVERLIDFVAAQAARADAEEQELLEARERALAMVEEKLAGLRQRHEARLAAHREKLRAKFPAAPVGPPPIAPSPTDAPLPPAPPADASNR